MSNNSLISNMSYTSRDFNSIYPELLDLVKKITYKWDPSISNESDPGVILLKLNALIADKCNYNIDKNVLECFPLSVTQESNARQLYEQLGYYMHWYRSAVTKVSFVWKDFNNYLPSSTSFVEIPRFTMVTDYDSDINYVIIGPEASELNAAANIKVPLSGEVITANAIQGVAVTYSINGREVIQASDLDSNNRLYFSDSDIAENGIFICNDDTSGSYNYASWKRKDNLTAENLGNTYYSFGILPGTESCYIEFPEDAESIFKSGLRIVYIRTLGRDGNIPARRLEKFANDIPTIFTSSNGEESTISLSTDIIRLSNLIPGEGGNGRESLQDAYRNYRHTIGTFNTLITLRDYINAIINGPQLVSNVIVSDRTTDIQCAYKLMSSVNNLSTLVNKVDTHNDKSTLDAYNIKIYALQYSSATIDTASEYDNSFKLIDNKNLSTIKLYVDDLKAIPHDITDLRTPEQSYDYVELEAEPEDWGKEGTKYYYWEEGSGWVKVEPGDEWDDSISYFERKYYFRSHYCMFKNIYPIECRITPIRTLEDVEKRELLSNLRQAIYENLNSQKIDFGQVTTPYDLERVITASDERISATSILNINMTTYVTYWNGKEFKDVRLNNFTEENPKETYLYSYSSALYKNVKASDFFREATGTEEYDWGVFTFKYIEGYTGGSWVMSKIIDNDGESAWEEVQDITYYADGLENISPANNDWFSIEINPIDRIRDEIYVKSVLQGITPLFNSDSEFNYDINQIQRKNLPGTNNSSIVDNIYYIETGLTINITPTNNTYKLRDNENIRFSTANLINSSNYSNYVKYYLVSGNNIPKDSNTELTSSEYLFLFWKETEDVSEPYSYAVYSKGFVVCPTFEVQASSSDLSGDAAALADLAANVVNVGLNYPSTGWQEFERYMTTNSMYRSISDSENEFATDLKNWLSSSKSIQIKHRNSLVLLDTYSCYWILNSPNEENEYVLFEDYSTLPEFDSNKSYKIGDKVGRKVTSSEIGEYKIYYECIEDVSPGNFDEDYWKELPAYEYVLDSGEYLYYQTPDNDGLNILGAGTRLTRPYLFDGKWAVPVVRQELITANGTDALLNKWFSWPTGSNLRVTEQQYTNIGSGATLFFKYKPGTSTPYTITSGIDEPLNDIATIKYTFNDVGSSASEESRYNNTLPDIGNIDYWRARSVLGLKVGEDEEQVLLEGQTLDLVLLNKDTIHIEGENKTESDPNVDYPLVFQSSIDLDTISATGRTYTFIINEDEQLVGSKLYFYTRSKSTNKRVFSSKGGAVCIFDPRIVEDEPESIDIEFSVPESSEHGGYMISVYNPNEDLTGATLTFAKDDVILYPMGIKTNSNLANQGTYYFNLGTLGGSAVLTVTLNNYLTGEQKAIVINKLYRYTFPKDINSTEKDEDKKGYMDPDEFNRYLALLQDFDYDHEFQYMYEVPEDSCVKNPLDWKSFLDPHHIYNTWTLCKFDTKSDNSSIQISSR